MPRLARKRMIRCRGIRSGHFRATLPTATLRAGVPGANLTESEKPYPHAIGCTNGNYSREALGEIARRLHLMNPSEAQPPFHLHPQPCVLTATSLFAASRKLKINSNFSPSGVISRPVSSPPKPPETGSTSRTTSVSCPEKWTVRALSEGASPKDTKYFG